MVLVRLDCLPVRTASLQIDLALFFLLRFQVCLVPLHDCLVMVAALLHLVSEVRVLVGDADLLLQALLFVVQLAKTIFEHLRLCITCNGVSIKIDNYFWQRPLTYLDLSLLELQLFVEFARTV